MDLFKERVLQKVTNIVNQGKRFFNSTRNTFIEFLDKCARDLLALALTFKSEELRTLYLTTAREVVRVRDCFIAK